MGPEGIRTLVIAVGTFFVVAFFGMTLVVIARDGVTAVVVMALAVIGLLGVALWGASSGPPTDRQR